MSALLTVAEFKILFPEIGIRAAFNAEIDVSAGAVGDLVIVSGTVYTMAAAESASDREWSTAAELVTALNSAEYGVSDLYALASGDVVSITAAPKKFVPQVFNKDGDLTLTTDADNTLAEHIEAATDTIERVVLGGRNLVEDLGNALIEDTEASGGNSSRLLLRAWPVSSLVSIREDSNREFADDTIIDADDYTVDLEKGIVLLKGGYFPQVEQTLRVEYFGGYPIASIPKTFKIACADQVKWTIENADTQAVTRARSGTIEVFRSATGALEGVSPLVQRLLDGETRE